MSRRYAEAKLREGTKVKVGFKGVWTEPEATSSGSDKSSVSSNDVEYC